MFTHQGSELLHTVAYLDHGWRYCHTAAAASRLTSVLIVLCSRSEHKVPAFVHYAGSVTRAKLICHTDQIWLKYIKEPGAKGLLPTRGRMPLYSHAHTSCIVVIYAAQYCRSGRYATFIRQHPLVLTCHASEFVSCVGMSPCHQAPHCKPETCWLTLMPCLKPLVPHFAMEVCGHPAVQP